MNRDNQQLIIQKMKILKKGSIISLGEKSEKYYLDQLNYSEELESICIEEIIDNELGVWVHKSILTDYLSYTYGIDRQTYYNLIVLGRNEVPKCICGRDRKFNSISKGYHDSCGSPECRRILFSETLWINARKQGKIYLSKLGDPERLSKWEENNK